MTKLISQTYETFPVSFPDDVYPNATQIATAFGTRAQKYLQSEQTQAYIAALAENLSKAPSGTLDKNQLVIVKKGGKEGQSGTWLHPKPAVDFARWPNPKFAVWCDEQIETLLHPEPATPTVVPVPQDKLLRAEAMNMNARTRQFQQIHKVLDKVVDKVSSASLEVLLLTSAEKLPDTRIDYRPVVRPTFSAADIGHQLGISANRVGKLANAHGLKTDTYGMTVLSKLRYSDTQVQTFVYYAEVLPVLRNLLQEQAA